jgi:hypothetical protein
MDKYKKKPKKINYKLHTLLIISITIVIVGYILRGTASALADHVTEGIGALIGGLGGLLLFIWFCLSIVSLLRKSWKR